MLNRVVAVTGSNRGIGLALVKRLAAGEAGTSHVVLCSRDMKKGLEARDSLGKVKAEVDVVELDMDSEESMDAFCDGLKNKYTVIHSLVNNAGIMVTEENTPKVEIMDRTIETNLFGPISLTDRILDAHLIEEKGKLLFVSSTLAISNFIRDEKLKKLLETIGSSQDINTAYLHTINLIKERKFDDVFVPRFPYSEYALSKLLLSKYAKLLSIDSRLSERGIFTASLCPGWCRTDMGGSMATNSVESGTDVLVDLLASDYRLDSSLHGRLVTKIGHGMSV